MKNFLNPEYLNTFVTAAETGKLNVTAELVFLTPAAVTVQVKKLEEQLGEPLFIRSKNSLALTRAGQDFLPLARQLLRLNKEAFAKIRNNPWEAEIAFGIPPDYFPDFCDHMLPDIKKAFPDHPFRLVCARSRVLRQKVEKGELAAAIVDMEPQFTQDAFLWEEKLYWVCGKNAVFSKDASLPVAVFTDNAIFNHYALYSLKHASIDYRIVLSSILTENIIKSVKSGMAASVLPKSCIDEDMQILPDDFLSIPLSQRMGYIRGNRLNKEFSDKLFLTIKTAAARRFA